VMSHRYLESALEHRRRNCEVGVQVDDVASVQATFKLYQAFATIQNGVNPKDEDNYELMIELWFEFAIVWGIGGSLTEAGRRK
jgi:dynein heavy chain, axonemal